jgi:transposase
VAKPLGVHEAGLQAQPPGRRCAGAGLRETPRGRNCLDAKEQFAVVYDAPDRIEAERRLELWLDLITAAGIPEFISTWRTLQWWRDEILNYFDDRVTNAFAEGIPTRSRS